VLQSQSIKLPPSSLLWQRHKASPLEVHLPVFIIIIIIIKKQLSSGEIFVGSLQWMSGLQTATVLDAAHCPCIPLSLAERMVKSSHRYLCTRYSQYHQYNPQPCQQFTAKLVQGGNLLSVNKFFSPGQKNRCYLFCIMRKIGQCGKYIRSLAFPLWTSFTVIGFQWTYVLWSLIYSLIIMHLYS
jgi:hypothetical protein